MIKTTILTGVEQEVTFAGTHTIYWVQNLGSGDILVGLEPELADGKDDVLIVPSGGTGYVRRDAGTKTVYLSGAGKAQVYGTNNAFCPFKAVSKGGGEVASESGTITAVTVDYPIVSLNLYGKSVQDGTPTPDTPIDIVSVGDDGAVEVAACGKNLYDISTATRQLVSEDGSVVNDPVYLLSDYISCSDYDKITISGVVGTGAVWYRLAKYDTDKNFIVRIAEKNVQTGAYTFDVSDCTYIRLCYEDEPVSDTVVTNVQVEYGATATAYEPFAGYTATITSGLPLCSVNGVRDELVYNADGKGKIIKRTAKKRVVADSTLHHNGTWQAGAWGINNFFTDGVEISSFVAVANYYCNYAPFNNGADRIVSTAGAIGVAQGGGKNLYFRFSAEHTTSEAVTNYLNANEVYIVYQLETPQEIELSAAEMAALMELQTFDGVTNIYNDEAAEMSIKIATNPLLSEYVKPVIDGITARFEARISALEAAITSNT